MKLLEGDLAVGCPSWPNQLGLRKSRWIWQHPLVPALNCRYTENRIKASSKYSFLRRRRTALFLRGAKFGGISCRCSIRTALVRSITRFRRIDLNWTLTRRSSSGWEVPSISRKSTSSRWTLVPVQCWSSWKSTILEYWSTAHCPWETMFTECVGLHSTSFARFVQSGNLSCVRLPRHWYMISSPVELIIATTCFMELISYIGQATSCLAYRCPTGFEDTQIRSYFGWHSWRIALVTCQAENQLQILRLLYVRSQVSSPWGTCLLVGHAPFRLGRRCSVAPSFRRSSRLNCSKNKNSALWLPEFCGVWLECSAC